MRYLTYTYTLTLKLTLTHTHTWNQLKQFRITLLRGFPKQFLKKRRIIEIQQSKIALIKFLCNITELNENLKLSKSLPLLLCLMTLATIEQKKLCDILY